MRILLAHNYYRSSAPSGEDAVFHNEQVLLERGGIDVIPFERYNDDIDESTLTQRVRLSLNTAWSKRTYDEMTEVLKKHRPDVAHFHNTFPLISPSAYAACQDCGVPVVQTLHNFRLICAAGLLLRDGRPCEDCVGTTLWPALHHRCYRKSLPATGALTWMLGRNRWSGTYQKLVNRYIALTRFAASRLKRGGLPPERIEVKPNFLPDPPPEGTGGGGYAVYVGRLSQEKGLRTLLSAWRLVEGFPLKIVGSGPLEDELRLQAKRGNLTVEFLGFQPREEVLKLVGEAEMQIVPSECYEGFPMVILEAYACGTPVVASDIGSLSEIVIDRKTGWKFQPGSPTRLADTINRLLHDRQQLRKLRHGVREHFDHHFTAEKNFNQLMHIYQNAILDFKARRQA